MNTFSFPVIHSAPFQTHSSFFKYPVLITIPLPLSLCFKYLFSSFSLVISGSHKCCFCFNPTHFHFLSVFGGERLHQLIFGDTVSAVGPRAPGVSVLAGGSALRCVGTCGHERLGSFCYMFGLGFLFHVHAWPSGGSDSSEASLSLPPRARAVASSPAASLERKRPCL